MLSACVQQNIVDRDVQGMIRQRRLDFVGVPFELLRTLNLFVHQFMRGFGCRFCFIGLFDAVAHNVFVDFNSHNVIQFSSDQSAGTEGLGLHPCRHQNFP